jgi:hypothetical protein
MTYRFCWALMFFGLSCGLACVGEWTLLSYYIFNIVPVTNQIWVYWVIFALGGIGCSVSFDMIERYMAKHIK